VLCPLPVIALDHDAVREWRARDERSPLPVPVARECGELLMVTWECVQSEIGLDADAEPPSHDLAWKVECSAGHVLVVQLIENPEDLHLLPYIAETVARALASIGGPS
jgi:hypothetical protein